MLKHLATRDIFRIFTVLEQVSTGVKIKVMLDKEGWIQYCKDRGIIYTDTHIIYKLK